MADWELIMPLVVVKSQGGIYDDASYVAGYEAALVECHLAGQKIPRLISKTVRGHNLKQIDLIAMRNNYILNVIGVLARISDQNDEWVVIELIPASEEPEKI